MATDNANRTTSAATPTASAATSGAAPTVHAIGAEGERPAIVQRNLTLLHSQADPPALDMRELLEISLRVQQSLRPAEVFAELARCTAEFCQTDSTRLSRRDGEIGFLVGKPARHRASYRLMWDHSFIGDLEVTRGRTFDEAELVRLEGLIQVTLPALRNAFDADRTTTLATIDPLTGVGNRRALHDALEAACAGARRHERPLSMLMLEIDHLTTVGELHGRAFAESVIRQVAEVLGLLVRASDGLFRTEAGTFVLLLPESCLDEAAQVAERIRTLVAATPLSPAAEQLPGLPLPTQTTVSVGVTAWQPTEGVDALLQRVDEALDDARQSGRNAMCSRAPGA